jgi:catechol 2,3-dioxygenase-like lactoylglutathione lyase family enzyme
MLDTSPLVAFVPSRDLERSRAFYVEVLGLSPVELNDGAVVVDAAGTIVRITKVDEFTPHPFTALGWACADIGVQVLDLGEREVRFVRFDGMDQDDLGIWESPGGDRVAWFRDPDGNVLSLTQPAGS